MCADVIIEYLEIEGKNLDASEAFDIISFFTYDHLAEAISDRMVTRADARNYHRSFRTGSTMKVRWTDYANNKLKKKWWMPAVHDPYLVSLFKK